VNQRATNDIDLKLECGILVVARGLDIPILGVSTGDLDRSYVRTQPNQPFRGPWTLLAAGLVVVSVVALTAAQGAAGAGRGAKAPARFLGPVLSQKENSGTSFGRDGGYSVALPNKTDFWIFADSPRWQFLHGKWRLTDFIPGSTAGIAPFTPGKPLTKRLIEVRPGSVLKTKNAPVQFMPQPNAYIPDGSGTLCRKYQARRPAFSARWPIGAALMPDKTNILIPYAVVCVLGESDFGAQGWGYALFNWRTRTFSVAPTDVFPADPSGTRLQSIQGFGSPIVVNKTVTFYSWVFGTSASGIYATSMPATVEALSNPASYQPQLIPGVRTTFNLHVAPKSKRHASFMMYQLRTAKGGYSIHTAPNPLGPWSEVASGVLPLCDTAPRPCHSMALHPELSPAGRLNVSYHVPGFGPGIATKHPYPREPLRHVVSASIPCGC
jgi:hypothetical protein